MIEADGSTDPLASSASDRRGMSGRRGQGPLRLARFAPPLARPPGIAWSQPQRRSAAPAYRPAVQEPGRRSRTHGHRPAPQHGTSPWCQGLRSVDTGRRGQEGSSVVRPALRSPKTTILRLSLTFRLARDTVTQRVAETPNSSSARLYPTSEFIRPGGPAHHAAHSIAPTTRRCGRSRRTFSPAQSAVA
jgi:hypothetical protein